MNRRISMTLASLFSAAIIIAIFCLGGAAAHAQLGWNPPCTTNPTKIVNTTNCQATIRLRTTPVALPPVTVPPGQSAPLNVPAGVTIFGLFTQAGTYVPLTVPGPVMPPPAPPVPAAAWVPGVTLGGACCANVYFDQSTAPSCVIWIIPAPAPCTP